MVELSCQLSFLGLLRYKWCYLKAYCAYTWSEGKKKPAGLGETLSRALPPSFPSPLASVGLREDTEGEGRPE